MNYNGNHTNLSGIDSNYYHQNNDSNIIGSFENANNIGNMNDNLINLPLI